MLPSPLSLYLFLANRFLDLPFSLISLLSASLHTSFLPPLRFNLYKKGKPPHAGVCLFTIKHKKAQKYTMQHTRVPFPFYIQRLIFSKRYKGMAGLHKK
jgi:hypothetical protein